jgi:hypothetical protein
MYSLPFSFSCTDTDFIIDFSVSMTATMDEHGISTGTSHLSLLIVFFSKSLSVQEMIIIKL